MSRTYQNIIIHCSASKWGSSSEIRKWHLEKGWSDIGYHFVIPNGNIKPKVYLESMNGTIETGRPIEKAGAHCQGGYNINSIGICLIGNNNFTYKQFDALFSLVRGLMNSYNIDIDGILGHYETPASHGKTCPNFNMDIFRNIIDTDWYDKSCVPFSFQHEYLGV